MTTTTPTTPPPLVLQDYVRPGTWGRLETEQMRAVQQAVAGKRVVDFGAGSLELSHMLVRFGALHVTAIDERPTQFPWDARVLLRAEPYAETEKACVKDERSLTARERETAVAIGAATVAFVSWCDTYPKPELIRLLGRFDTVVHLSKNSDGMCCGWPALYEYLATRPLAAYHPRRQNTLAVYGVGPVQRPMRPEETAGAKMWASKAFSWASMGEDEPASPPI